MTKYQKEMEDKRKREHKIYCAHIKKSVARGGYTIKELADLFGVSKNSIERVLYRAINKLRSQKTLSDFY
jgi:DNA-directed RNA polymerase sigma subunit (sigma70/sigma32)